MAATDPVRRVGRDVYPVDFVVNLKRELNRLADYTPSNEVSCLTVTVDLTPQGTDPNRRPGLDQVRDDLERLVPPDSDRSPRGVSLRQDRDKILDEMPGHVGGESIGLVVVACSAQGLFEVIPVGLAVPTEVSVGPSPNLTTLARFAEDHPLYAVLLLDQREAHLTTIAQGRRRRSVDVRGTDFPHHQQQGGWSQRRYQNRADERVEHFVAHVAEETRTAVEAGQITMLVLAGDDQITPQVRDELHQTVRDRIVGEVRLPIQASPADVVEATLPIVEEAERGRERAAVDDVKDGVGQGADAVAGPEDVLRALEAGQARMLVLNDDYAVRGWADYGLLTFGVGSRPEEHPAGGDVGDIVEVDLANEFIRMALQTGAEVEVVTTDVPVSLEEQIDIRDPETSEIPRAEAAIALDALGGVGAVLRFAIGESGSPVMEE